MNEKITDYKAKLRIDLVYVSMPRTLECFNTAEKQWKGIFYTNKPHSCTVKLDSLVII